jgi:hypothetical protein
MSTSYANSGGTGDRRSIIAVTQSTSLFVAGTVLANFVDGATANNGYIPSGSVTSSMWLRWDFGAGCSKLIDEIKFYFELAYNQATWQFQGSNDGSTWTDIDTPKTISGSATVTVALTNTTGYRYYQMLGSSGTVNQTWWREIEFKLDELNHYVRVTAIRRQAEAAESSVLVTAVRRQTEAAASSVLVTAVRRHTEAAKSSVLVTAVRRMVVLSDYVPEDMGGYGNSAY